VIDAGVAQLGEHVPTATACRLLGKPRASHYRQRQHPRLPRQRQPRPTPPNALSSGERQQLLEVLNSARFADKSVAQTWATLLDEGVYLASMSTMHRVLRAAGQCGERRRQAAHPPRTRPELVATGPGQVWSWDITKLRGPARGQYFDLYVILDIYSAASWAGPSPPPRTPRSPRTSSPRRSPSTAGPAASTPTAAPR
jgi:putative transposase